MREIQIKEKNKKQQCEFSFALSPTFAATFAATDLPSLLPLSNHVRIVIFAQRPQRTGRTHFPGSQPGISSPENFPPRF